MTYACFLTVNGPEELAHLVRERIERHTIPALRKQGTVNFVSLFAPVAGQEDPYVKGQPPPELLVQIDADDLERVDSFFADAELVHQLETAKAGSVTCEAFETIWYPIEGVAEPARRTAPLSFNVRYYAPVEDERRFVDFYLAHHPRIMVELPGVRNVLCYVPVAWSNPTTIPISNCILGNEVVFDSVEALNDTLASEVRRRLRDDYDAFPIRPGPNTHLAMHRQDFWMD